MENPKVFVSGAWLESMAIGTAPLSNGPVKNTGALKHLLKQGLHAAKVGVGTHMFASLYNVGVFKEFPFSF